MIVFVLNAKFVFVELSTVLIESILDCHGVLFCQKKAVCFCCSCVCLIVVSNVVLLLKSTNLSYLLSFWIVLVFFSKL